MFLENLVLDAIDPQHLGRFWQRALGADVLTDEPDGFECRLAVDGGPTLDLCFPRVPEPPALPQRLHLDLYGAQQQAQTVERLLALGAEHADVGQGDVPWVVLADVEGNPFCVMAERAAYSGTGPIAALPVDCADPARDAEFWSLLSGWTDAPGIAPRTLRHPSGRGPLLEFCEEPAPKDPHRKNGLHLDLRLEPGEDMDVAARRIADLGGRALSPDWGELPWRVFSDPSGNEFCVLPAPQL